MKFDCSRLSTETTVTKLPTSKRRYRRASVDIKQPVLKQDSLYREKIKDLEKATKQTEDKIRRLETKEWLHAKQVQQKISDATAKQDREMAYELDQKFAQTVEMKRRIVILKEKARKQQDFQEFKRIKEKRQREEVRREIDDLSRSEGRSKMQREFKLEKAKTDMEVAAEFRKNRITHVQTAAELVDRKCNEQLERESTYNSTMHEWNAVRAKYLSVSTDLDRIQKLMRK